MLLVLSNMPLNVDGLDEVKSNATSSRPRFIRNSIVNKRNTSNTLSPSRCERSGRGCRKDYCFRGQVVPCLQDISISNDIRGGQGAEDVEQHWTDHHLSRQGCGPVEKIGKTEKGV